MPEHTRALVGATEQSSSGMQLLRQKRGLVAMSHAPCAHVSWICAMIALCETVCAHSQDEFQSCPGIDR